VSTQIATAIAIVPSLGYDDAPGAIEFLQTAFGFAKHAVHANPDGTIAHAELRLGPNFIMLGSTRDDAPAWTSRSPRQLGGVTGGIYIVLERDEDVDAHHARASAAGAKIIRAPESPDYGGRGYSAQDPEGHHWSFGSYRPGP
jgi:uncharacterized glyoxalase superfamily protein PhnB